MKRYSAFLAGQPVDLNNKLVVYDKYTRKQYAEVSSASPKDIAKAITAAESSRSEMQKLPSWQRQQILEHCIRRFRERKDELAQILCREAGKPLKDSYGEVDRLIVTFKIAAEEAVRRIERVAIIAAGDLVGVRGVVDRLALGLNRRQ